MPVNARFILQDSSSWRQGHGSQSFHQGVFLLERRGAIISIFIILGSSCTQWNDTTALFLGNNAGFVELLYFHRGRSGPKHSPNQILLEVSHVVSFLEIEGQLRLKLRLRVVRWRGNGPCLLSCQSLLPLQLFLSQASLLLGSGPQVRVEAPDQCDLFIVKVEDLHPPVELCHDEEVFLLRKLHSDHN